MHLTPAIKGQLTKAVNLRNNPGNRHQAVFQAVHTIFHRHMPHEQAKHAARKYIATHV